MKVGSHLILPGSHLDEMKILHMNTCKWASPTRWGRVFFNQFAKKFYFLGEGNLICCCTGSRGNYIGWVGRQNDNNNPDNNNNNDNDNNNNNNFRVGISKNKNIDHRVKETCAVRSTQVHMKLTTFLYPAIQRCQVH